MSIKSRTPGFFILLLIISSLACNLSSLNVSTSEPTDDNYVVLLTSAAATVEAVLSATPNTATPIPVIVASPSPISPPEPTAIATPAASKTVVPILRVAYIKDGNVYLWTEGAGIVGLTSTHDAMKVRITDDGQEIAFTRQDPNTPFVQELWVVNTNGLTDARVLVSAADLAELKAISPDPDFPGLGLLQFEWRPGTHLLTYSTIPLFEGVGSATNNDLRLVNADTLQKSVLFDFNQGGFFYYSPDGNQLALVRPDFISLVNADGTNLRANVLTYPLVGTYSEYQYHPHPLWAADSTSLRVAIPPAETLADPLPPTDLWKIPIDGSPAIHLGSVIAIPFAWPDNAFAPDLERVIYAKPVGDPADNQRELHIANPNGSADMVFAAGALLEFEQWTPDSTRFVYTIRGGENKGLYLGNIAGGNFTLATDPGLLSQMRWVDRSRFLYFWKDAGVWELRLSDVDGTASALLDTIPDTSAYYDFIY